MKRRLCKRIFVFLLAGAIVNVAVAWGIGASLNASMPDAREQTGSGPGGWSGVESANYWQWIVFKHSAAHSIRTISRWSDKGTGGGGSGDWPDDPAEPLIPPWAPQLSPEQHAPIQEHHY